jgi:hypothetical protein
MGLGGPRAQSGRCGERYLASAGVPTTESPSRSLSRILAKPTNRLYLKACICELESLVLQTNAMGWACGTYGGRCIEGFGVEI